MRFVAVAEGPERTRRTEERHSCSFGEPVGHSRSRASPPPVGACAKDVSVRVALTLLLVLGGASTTHGQDAAAAHDDEGRQLFEAGRMAFADARYEDALERFEEAYRMSGRPALLYNIGQCLDRLRRDAEAADTFERYLAAEPTAANRHEVEQRIQILRAGTRDRALEEDDHTAPMETAPSTEALGRPLLEDPPPHATQVYEQWWFWTIVVGVAGAGVGIGLGVALGSRTAPEDPIIPAGGLVMALEGP